MAGESANSGGAPGASPPEAIQHMSSHILAQLQIHRARHAPSGGSSIPVPPLLVGVQGPQGSGKTYLTSILRDTLKAPPHNLSAAVLSLDDLYLPHDGLVAVARAHPHNGLLQGRGQPGTHDIALGTEVLTKLKHINESPLNGPGLELPSFDKSLFDGEGDRAPGGAVVRPPVDVVLFEGWCVGFYPIPRDEVERRWTRPLPGLEEGFLNKKGYRIEDVLDINERLKDYIAWWDLFDTFIQIRPPDDHPYDFIYKWRLQQEHHMKARNGGRGMSDEQVASFVDRYIPGYVFFGNGVTDGYEETPGARKLPPWSGRALCIVIGEYRELIRAEAF
ncbi:P-loop containing nucleoside triphosphate hydrolase protein [Lentinus brumalis]|uniref:P-loop containing nucleoside triphosphate hydrolase protein n=1 Tax=Lentinus brumalis TaxID=2498619 RepID=A0A371D9T8_9APHY|nr:P-loop containing nucleoside triphosphate hydrolase protein [Polyporus brumalis]